MQIMQAADEKILWQMKLSLYLQEVIRLDIRVMTHIHLTVGMYYLPMIRNFGV
jgi:hypothetical protein